LLLKQLILFDSTKPHNLDTVFSAKIGKTRAQKNLLKAENCMVGFLSRTAVSDLMHSAVLASEFTVKQTHCLLLVCCDNPLSQEKFGGVVKKRIRWY